jgi:VanZ family protein
MKLRYSRLWYAIGYGLVALVVYLSLFSHPPAVGYGQSDKLAHGFAYAALMGWFIQLHADFRKRLLVAVLLTSMGVALEFLQSLNPIRHFDVADMIANTSGVLIAWALGFTSLGSLLARLDQRLSRVGST